MGHSSQQFIYKNAATAKKRFKSLKSVSKAINQNDK